MLKTVQRQLITLRHETIFDFTHCTMYSAKVGKNLSSEDYNNKK